jgi:uncharacterized protein YuzE
VRERDRERTAAQSRLSNIELEMAALTVDFDSDGKVMGFELLGARRLLPAELLSE